MFNFITMDGGSTLVQWKWQAPAPPGRGSATDSMTGIAAPLLAGFSLTLIGVIAQDPTNFRWPGATLVTLVITMSLLIASVQFGFHARARLYSAAEIRDWRPDFFEKKQDILAEQQRFHEAQWELWADRARLTYNAAICILAVSLAMTVAPSHGSKEVALRWSASALALAGGVAEVSWIAADYGDAYARVIGFLRRHMRILRSSKVPDQDAKPDAGTQKVHENGADNA
jgi:hypothetical protein